MYIDYLTGVNNRKKLEIYLMENYIFRINDCVEKYNSSSSKPYKLSFSMGHAVYDYYSNMTVEEFEKHIDLLMYENKRKNKEIKSKN